MIFVAQEKTKRNSSPQTNRSPGRHTQPVLSSAVSYPPWLLTQYLLRPAEASPPGPIALSLLPLSVEYVHSAVEKTEEKIRSATHTDIHRDRKGRAREAYIVLSFQVGSFVQEHLRHFPMTITSGPDESSTTTLSETDTHSERETPRDG